MQNRLLAPAIPFDYQSRPTFFGYDALVGLVILPTNLIADFQESGLFAGHVLTSSKRFIGVWPVKL
jgi:hypothetical protein